MSKHDNYNGREILTDNVFSREMLSERRLQVDSAAKGAELSLISQLTDVVKSRPIPQKREVTPAQAVVLETALSSMAARALGSADIDAIRAELEVIQQEQAGISYDFPETT